MKLMGPEVFELTLPWTVGEVVQEGLLGLRVKQGSFSQQFPAAKPFPPLGRFRPPFLGT